MDLNIDKKIKRMVKKALNEELGISTIVTNSANDILHLIESNIDKKIEKREYAITLENKGYRVSGDFQYPFCDTDITIKYESYIFSNDSIYREMIKKYPNILMNAHSIVNAYSAEIFVVVNMTYEGYDESIYDRLQHELEHVYQALMKGGLLSDSELKKRVNKGLKMAKTDKDIFYAAFILYCSRQYEQDATANGLYSWLCNGTNDKSQIIHDSAIVKNRRICLKYLKRLEDLYSLNNAETNHKIKRFFGIPLGNIINKGYNTCNKMRDKANRAIFKYGKDTGTDIKGLFI